MRRRAGAGQRRYPLPFPRTVTLRRSSTGSIRNSPISTRCWRAAAREGLPAARTRFGSQSAQAPYLGQCWRSEEHTSELQSLMRISYAVFCLKKKKQKKTEERKQKKRAKYRTHNKKSKAKRRLIEKTRQTKTKR